MLFSSARQSFALLAIYNRNEILKTTSNRFNKKPIQNSENKPQDELIKIPKDVLSSWFKTLKESSRRPRFVTKEDSDRTYLDLLIEQERRNVAQLWEAFTIERGNLPRYLQDPKKQTAAYMIDFYQTWPEQF